MTATTLSEDQYAYAQQRVKGLGLEDRITLLKKDYRELSGQYDKLVSVEMIEHVGQKYLAEYFRCCERLLKKQGIMVLQAIVFSNPYFAVYTRNVDFAQKYIFPGVFLPTLDLICLHIRKQTDFCIQRIEDFGGHYTKITNLWWKHFDTNQISLCRQGYDERFTRLWRYYLNYCEAGFSEGTTSVVQLVANKRVSTSELAPR